MKVLKGHFKGVELTVPDGMLVRPTVDHFKKHVTRIFEEYEHSVVWDLFAGSGGVGIEFLSLGARHAVFVEQLTKAINCIKLNLAECRLKDPAAFATKTTQVLTAPSENFLKNPVSFGVTQAPDLVFLDPPYGQAFMSKILPHLLDCSLISSDTLIIAEHVTEDPLGDDARRILISSEIYGPKILSCFKKKS